MSLPSPPQRVGWHSVAASLLAVMVLNSSFTLAQQKTAEPPPPPGFGLPLLGLTPDQRAAFMDGKEDFEEVETVDGGLGPIFNFDSCAKCHSVPTLGGSIAIL